MPARTEIQSVFSIVTDDEAVSDGSAVEESAMKLRNAQKARVRVEELDKERDTQRRQISDAYDKEMTAIKKRLVNAVSEHRKRISRIHADHVSRLIQAVELRDSKQRVISVKLAELQRRFSGLAGELKVVLKSRRKEACDAETAIPGGGQQQV